MPMHFDNIKSINNETTDISAIYQQQQQQILPEKKKKTIGVILLA